MTSRPRIRIRRDPGRPGGLRTWKYPGWAWRCDCCETGGRASTWSRVRGEPRTPAYNRAIAAVNRHLRERHRDAHYAYVLRKRATP